MWSEVWNWDFYWVFVVRSSWLFIIRTEHTVGAHKMFDQDITASSGGSRTSDWEGAPIPSKLLLLLSKNYDKKFSVGIDPNLLIGIILQPLVGSCCRGDVPLPLVPNFFVLCSFGQNWANHWHFGEILDPPLKAVQTHINLYVLCAHPVNSQYGSVINRFLSL